MANEDIYRPDIKWHWYPDPVHEEFERCFISVPGFRDPGPRDGTWCGVHGMELSWNLRGPRGALEFSVATNWLPGEIGNDYRWLGTDSTRVSSDDLYPYAPGIAVHARAPQREGHYGREDCLMFGPEPEICYPERYGLLGDDLLVEWSKEGDRVVWDKLYELHQELV